MASINHYTCEAKQPISINGVDDADLTNSFNSFFSRFKRPDLIYNVSSLRDSLAPQNNFVISEEYLTALFTKTHIRKAAGPDATYLVVDTYKYLGTLFDSQLKFDANTDSIVKRDQRRS